MPVDVRAALRGALDVEPPVLAGDVLRRRAAAQWLREHRRRARSLLAAATLVLAGAVVAGSCANVQAAPIRVAAPVPAPIPLAT